MNQKRFQTLLEALYEVSQTDKGITFIDSMEQEEFVSYQRLYRQAYQVSLYLKSINIEPESEIVFQFSNLRGLIKVFWGCLMGNFIPIPVAVVNNEYTNGKLFNIWQTLNHPYLIYDQDDLLTHIAEYPIPDTDKLVLKEIISRSVNYQTMNQNDPDIDEPLRNIPVNNPNQTAYIQFSSGSTGNPKGVMISHHNVLTNIFDTIQHFQLSNEDSFITWKPLIHDFSMIMFHLLPIVLGAPTSTN